MQDGALARSSEAADLQGRRLVWGLPPLSSNLILRRRLFPKLGSAAHGGVTLVAGPPGSGKSALVSGWARYTDPGEVVWLSLSPDDNRDPDLWSRVDAELATFIGAEGLDTVASTAPLDEHPIILVIDNVEVISETRLSDGLASLAERLAGRVGLVLIGRHAAHLPLHRLGMRISLTEIGPDELACTEEETAEFLAVWCPEPAPPEWAAVLCERSEGWAGGLRLACLMMAELDSFFEVDDCLRTDWGLIADYFEKEVVEQHPLDVREFMRGTAVLDELAPDICNSVSGHHDALQLLEALARQNVFVRRVPGTDSFRYHGLFREFLRHQLALSGSDAETKARLLAYRSLDQKGHTEAAMGQLRAAGAFDELFALALRNTIEALEVGHPVRPELALPAGLPDSYFERSPLRMYPLCVSYLTRLELEKAVGWLRRMERAVGAVDDSSGLRARCEFLWAIYDLALMNGQGVLRHLESSPDWLETDRSAEFYRSLRDGYQWVRELDSAISSLAPMMEAQGELWRGRAGRAGQILSEAYGLDRATTDPVLAAVFGSVLLAEGQLRQALELAEAALVGIDGADRSESTTTVGLRLVIARVMYERDDLARAEEQLALADRICVAAGQERWRAGIDCELARLDMARGRAHDALRRLDAMRTSEPLSRNVPLQHLAHEVEVQCRLSLGDLLGAEDLLVDCQDLTPSPELLARFHLGTGRPDRASVELSRSGFTARGRPSIERLLLQTRVFLQAGNRRAAEHALQRAVNLARADGFVRVFLDEPKQISDLLASVSAGGVDSFVQDLLSRVPARRQAGGSPHPFILEPLTERERELLGYLPCHLSQSEIASRMFISANTVKTHMKGLYRKLGASSRSEAVDIARDCGLLSTTIGV